MPRRNKNADGLDNIEAMLEAICKTKDDGVTDANIGQEYDPEIHIFSKGLSTSKNFPSSMQLDFAIDHPTIPTNKHISKKVTAELKSKTKPRKTKRKRTVPAQKTQSQAAKPNSSKATFKATSSHKSMKTKKKAANDGKKHDAAWEDIQANANGFDGNLDNFTSDDKEDQKFINAVKLMASQKLKVRSFVQ